MMRFQKSYWEKRYQEGDTGWDIGHVSTPLKEYFDQLKDKNSSILIPGCGNAYEAEYLYRNGFKNVYLLDLAPLPLKNFLKRVPLFPKGHLICEDFFDHSRKYDLIIEQTFFCALNPSDRARYAKKVHALLKKGGKLTGLLFDCEFEKEGPPFGGSRKEYQKYFEPYFQFDVFETACNSISPRDGRELFCILTRKQ